MSIRPVGVHLDEVLPAQGVELDGRDVTSVLTAGAASPRQAVVDDFLS